MGGWQSSTREVAEMLSALSLKVRACAEPFTGRHVAESLHGLWCQSSTPQVAVLQTALLPKVQQACMHPFSIRNVSRCLGSFGQQVDTPQAAALLRLLFAALLPRLRMFTEPFDQAVVT